jgi:hypothetical protein
VSNPIRFDPPLVRALAAELHARLHGRAAHPVPVFAADRSATLLLDRGEALRWDLHPTAGWVRVVPRPPDDLPSLDARIVGVSAPPDERRLRIDLREGGRFKGGSRSLVFELHTNQWNALLVDGGDRRIVSVLRSREAGGRVLRTGAVYAPPAGEPRLGAKRMERADAWAAFRDALAPLPAAERRHALLRGFAAASPLNAGHILGIAGDAASPSLDGSGDGGGEAALAAAFERWWGLVTMGEARAVVLRAAPPSPVPSPARGEGDERAGPTGNGEPSAATGSGWEGGRYEAGASASKAVSSGAGDAGGRRGMMQPYPVPLDGFAWEEAPSVLAAMARVAEAAADAVPARADVPSHERLMERARRRLSGAERRVAGLRREREGVGQAERLRAIGDVLLAHLHLIPPGAESVRLPDFEGGEIEVALDPSLRPADNARRYYDDAGRRSRAEARLPELMAAAEADLARWQGIVAAGEAGALPEAAVRVLARLDAPPSARKAAAGDAQRKPYRVYRTSGGLEVRVGRSSRDNDRLTFGHCRPDEVWLHARGVPGSHVILRWPSADAAPPARDLEEAAVLAAVHSKARTSGVVAVDWTRRKHVRKPRGAPPGMVKLLQARTVMVEPDPALEERLRVDEAAE